LQNKSQIFGAVGEFLVKFFYYLFPKPWDMQDIGAGIIKGAAVDYMPLVTSILFTAIMISLTIVYFRKKDY
jgi:hypothetical protein